VAASLDDFMTLDTGELIIQGQQQQQSNGNGNNPAVDQPQDYTDIDIESMVS
jgi:hypothetical protein